MPKRILIVDDNQTVRLLADRVLSKDGFITLEAETGAQATELMHSSQPTAALVDVNLPDGDGYDFVRSWRQAGFDIPIIMSSGFPREQALGSDVKNVQFLAKPFRPSQLRNTVNEALA